LHLVGCIQNYITMHGFMNVNMSESFRVNRLTYIILRLTTASGGTNKSVLQRLSTYLTMETEIVSETLTETT